MLIEVEESDKKKGYFARIQSLRDVKDTNKLICNYQKLNGNCDQKKAIELLKKEKENAGTDKRSIWNKVLNFF